MNKKISWDSWDSNMLDQFGPAYWSDVETDDDAPAMSLETATETAYFVTREEWDSFHRFFQSIGCDEQTDGYGYVKVDLDIDHYLDMGSICDSDCMRHPESDGLWVGEMLLEEYNNDELIGDCLYTIDHEYNVCIDGLDDVDDMYEPESDEWYEERENCINRYYDRVVPLVQGKLTRLIKDLAERAVKEIEDYTDELIDQYMKGEI